MLDKPNFDQARLIAQMRAAYGLPITQLTFLPVGADIYSAAYRVETETGQTCFLKVRTGNFDETSVTVPDFFVRAGISHIMSPLPTLAGQLYTEFETAKLILYPFVDGKNGWEEPLTDDEWRILGAALKRVHTTALPDSIWAQVPKETFPTHWREQMALFLAKCDAETFTDPAARQLAAIINDKRDVLRDIIARHERLGAEVQSRSPTFVLCHSDVHLGNVIHNPQTQEFYVVDWDSPMLAPKEYDLKCFGGSWTTPRQEALFYESYGAGQVDRAALAFYCFQRILEDVGASCENVFTEGTGEENKALELTITRAQFAPGDAVEMAYKIEAGEDL